MRLGVLGPLLVVDDGGTHVHMAAPRLRVLLAALLLHANSPVSAEALAELVWDGAPPGRAAITLRTYVHRLRAVLGPAWARRIVTHPPGYLCRADSHEVDALGFEALCGEANTAAHERQWVKASEAAERAVSLWRGAPLLDIPCRSLHDEFTPRLEQLYAQVLENQAGAALALGRHEQWVQPLRVLVAAHPLRERFHGQLMQALASCGRQAEALAAYQNVRKVLVAELGIEPGPELRRLHERILAGNGGGGDGDALAPRLLANLAAEGTQEGTHEGTHVAVVPRQLPAATGHFTGRRAEMDLIAGMYSASQSANARGHTVVISAIDGMAGIGKTALAIHAAHRLAEDFPDGQLFIDLHGHTKGQRPRTAAQALGWLLRALGVPPQQIPKEGEQAAALFRQHLAGTRTLIVLDNAATEAQVRPLLPGGGSCLVLITSRRRLKGLDDARTLSLDLLPAPNAVALLRAVAELEHVPADDRLWGEIAELCGYLPLALRIAAALLRHRPAWTLQHLAGLLRDQRRRLPVLSDGDRDLASVFDLSYQSLAEQHRLLFRRLGLIPGPDLDAYAAAALAEVDPARATGLLEDLVDHNLLLSHSVGRYRLHDLIRAHAQALADNDPPWESEAARERLLRYYTHTAHAASIPITRLLRPVPAGPAPIYAPALPDAEAARAWLRAERDNLEHAHTYAHTHQLHEHSLSLAAGLAEILRSDGPYARAVALHQAAAETAQQHGDAASHADALTDLGIARRLSGDLTGAVGDFGRALEIYGATGDRHGEADTLAELGRARGYGGDLAGSVDAFGRALEIYRVIGDRHGEADMLAELGIMRRVSGDLAGSVDAFGRALEIYGVTGDRHGEADALTELGRVRGLIGDLAGADGALGRALEFYRATGHHHGEAYVLTNLGTVRRLIGDLVGAEDVLGRALEIYRSIGYAQGEAEALANLGIIRRLTGAPAAARDAQARALEIYRQIGSRHDEAWALNHYAATIAAEGDQPRALALYRQALAMNRELNKPDGQAHSLEGLGECHLAAEDTANAATHLRQALKIYQRLGMHPDTHRVQHRLDSLA